MSDELWKEITKHTPINLERKDAEVVENQTERTQRETRNLSEHELRIYVVAKAREFENLRKIYERDIKQFKQLAQQAGINADRDVQRAAVTVRAERDGHWMAALCLATGDEDIDKAAVARSVNDWKILADVILKSIGVYEKKKNENNVETGQVKALPAGS